jgi:hypothetical protein
VHKFTETSHNPLTGAESSVEVQTNAATLPEVLLAFESYLRGCGFTFSGDLVIEEPYVPPPLHQPHFSPDEKTPPRQPRRKK